MFTIHALIYVSMGAIVGGMEVLPEYTLKLLDASRYPRARCLDGTQGGYYIGPTPATDSSVFLIHLQGGGWCTSLDDCAARAGTHYGSSRSWTSGECPDAQNMACWADNPTGVPAGLGSPNATESPLFANAVHIWVPYCDGASLSGDATPIPFNSTLTLHFNGHAILESVLDELVATENLASARAVLLKGCSAGGQAVYLHADYVAARVRAASPSARFAAAPGAGLFLNVTDFAGTASFASYYKWVAETQNVTASLNPACLSAFPVESRWQCFLPVVALDFVNSSLFISNSLVDSCAALFIMDLGCDARVPSGLPLSCSADQLKYLSEYRASMIAVVSPVLARRSDYGAFLQSCWTHIVEDDGVSWNGTLVQGQTQAATFAAWWLADDSARTVVVDATEFGGNPTCSNWGTCY